MTATTSATESSAVDREMEARYRLRLEREVDRVREQARREVEEFKRSFPPPSDEQIERLLYPELSEFHVELGGRRFTLRELPALTEKKFLRLVEQKLPALVAEVLSLEERLSDDAEAGFVRLLTRATSALDLVAEVCVLVLDPAGAQGLTAEFVQQNASTARQLRILQAQTLLNGARDFLSRLFPALGNTIDPSGRLPGQAGAAASSPTPGSPPLSVGSSSSANHPVKSESASPRVSSA